VNKSVEIVITYIGELNFTMPDEVCLVENDVGYVSACCYITEALRQEHAARVMVRKKTYYLWLCSFADQINCTAYFEEKTASLLLADQWNVTLPEWLSDDEVIANQLLDLEVDADNESSFESRYLSLLIDPVFKMDKLNPSELVPLMKALVNTEVEKSFEDSFLLFRCFEEKCNQWAEKSSEPWVIELCKRLPKEYKRIWQWLSIWVVLSNYPSKLLEYLLAPDQLRFVKNVPTEVIEGLQLEPNAKEQIITQLNMFFEEVGPQVQSSIDFQKLLTSTSGHLFQEYWHLVSILKSGQFEPTEADVDSVREKYAKCSGVSESHLRALSSLVKPMRPTVIKEKEEWDALSWIDWTINEYIPYRAWQVNNARYDQEVEKSVAAFSDWYFRDYINVQKDVDLSLTYSLQSDFIDCSESELTIILLIDCLPLTYFDIIDQAIQSIGLKRHDFHCRYSLAPTVSDINKTALLSGGLELVDNSYEAIIKERAKTDWGNKQTYYLPNLKALSEFNLPKDSSVVVLNYLDGDEILHTDVESKKTTYEEELHRLYTRVVKELERIAKLWPGSKELFDLIVITDHGACRILEEEKTTFDSTVVKKIFENEKYRFAPVSKEQADKIPNNLWTVGYRFIRPFSTNEELFFLPRGHNTVRPAKSVKGHMHGGITPEEVIVPVAHYKLVKTVFDKLFVRFPEIDLVHETGRAKFYVQRVEVVKIELQNPNKEDVNIYRVTVLSPETDLKDWQAEIVPAGGSALFKISCYFNKKAVGEKTMEIEIAYEVGSEKFTQIITLDSEFKSAMSGGFSLKDL